MTLLQGQQLLKGQQFADQGIGCPARPQGLDPLPSQAVPLEIRIPGGNQHGAGSHFAEQQTSLQQRQWHNGIVIGKADGTVFQQIAVGCQLVSFAVQAETSPEGQVNRRRVRVLQADQALRLIPPALPSRQQGHLAVSTCGSATPQAADRFRWPADR